MKFRLSTIVVAIFSNIEELPLLSIKTLPRYGLVTMIQEYFTNKNIKGQLNDEQLSNKKIKKFVKIKYFYEFDDYL